MHEAKNHPHACPVVADANRTSLYQLSLLPAVRPAYGLEPYHSLTLTSGSFIIPRFWLMWSLFHTNIVLFKKQQATYLFII